MRSFARDVKPRHERRVLLLVGGLSLLLFVWNTLHVLTYEKPHEGSRDSHQAALFRSDSVQQKVEEVAPTREAARKDVLTLRPEPMHAAPTSTGETWPMQDKFYTSHFPPNDTSTTIIFNLFKGHPEALRMQLEAAAGQLHVSPPEIWVMCFNSPLRREYEAVVEAFKARTGPTLKSRVVVTASDFNHKFHGRFLLAYMARTKYVLIVDDDKNLDATAVSDYIRHMRMQKGVWGNFGHLRASTFEGYKSWPRVGYDLSQQDYAEMDYLSGMWFLEQSWLEYFVKERPPSWETSEDMHLSHVMRKYLNLNTYGGKIALSAPGLPAKSHAATVGPALDLREFIFDHQLGRGNKVANVDQPIDSLLYAETAEEIDAFIARLDQCSHAVPALRVEKPVTSVNPICTAGRVAAVFRGATDQDVVSLIAAAERLCHKTDCECWSVKPKIKHPIRFFNMREGFGQDNVDIPYQTAAADVLTSLVGVLNNVLPRRIFVPADSVTTQGGERFNGSVPMKNRLQIYQDTVHLAVSIHASSPSNRKWKDRDDSTRPNIEMYSWQ